MSQNVVVSGAFDDLRSRQIRFLEEASRIGHVTVMLWTDSVVEKQTGKPPLFPFEERRYVLQSMRYVGRVLPVRQDVDTAELSADRERKPGVLVVHSTQDDALNRAAAAQTGMAYRVLTDDMLTGFPSAAALESGGGAGRKRVIVTGCYDWFHSGHVRFFEEVSGLGELYVVVGHDANIRTLKGEGHPLFPAAERRYVVAAVRFVKEALVATGEGWVDAEPEIERIRPHIYAVNEDGDKGGKREFCAERGIEYVVLKRAPAPGLPKRSSTELRGF